MSICFKLGTAEWNCVTKGKIHLGSFCFLARDCFLPSCFTSERAFSTKLIGQPLSVRRFLKLFISSSNDALEDFVWRNQPKNSQTKYWLYCKSKGKRAQYYTSIFKEALLKMRKNGESDESLNDPDNTMLYNQKLNNKLKVIPQYCIAHTYCA